MSNNNCRQLPACHVTCCVKNNDDLDLVVTEHTAYGKGFIKTCCVSSIFVDVWRAAVTNIVDFHCFCMTLLTNAHSMLAANFKGQPTSLSAVVCSPPCPLIFLFRRLFERPSVTAPFCGHSTAACLERAFIIRRKRLVIGRRIQEETDYLTVRTISALLSLHFSNSYAHSDFLTRPCSLF